MTDIVVTDNEPVQLQQRAGQNRQRVLDVSLQAIPFWQPLSFIAANGVMRPTDANANGFAFKNGSTAGQTSAVEPAWPKLVGGTVVDGSVTWTAAAPPISGEDTVSSASWTQISPPDGTLTITGQTTTSLTASAFIGGGTSGSTYQVLVAITMTSGAIYNVLLVITVV